MEPTFIRNAARNRAYDWLKQTVKRHSPDWFVTVTSSAMRPLVLAREEIRFQLALRTLLEPAMARRFGGLYRDARRGWEIGRCSSDAKPIEVHLPSRGATLYLRPGTTDIILFRDIFIRRQYGFAPVKDVRTIVDCGANVGLASAFLLLEYPDARVIAVEPDPSNFELCQRNLAQFGSRAVVLQAAVWPRSAAVVMNDSHRGTWAATVSEGSGPGQLPGISLSELFDRFGLSSVDILKVDIEGAEEPVFASPELGWLDRVRCIQIELEPSSRATFFHALAGRGFSYMQHTEATIAYRT